jgi:hypothetical protein
LNKRIKKKDLKKEIIFKQNNKQKIIFKNHQKKSTEKKSKLLEN